MEERIFDSEPLGDLRVRYFAEVYLRLKTPLHIGLGELEAFRPSRAILQVPIIKKGESFIAPVIPSSSIKGALKSEAERLAKGMGFLPETHDYRMGHERELKAKLMEELIGKGFRGVELEEKIEKELLDHELKCPVCKLFGSPRVASRVNITDALPVEEEAGEKSFKVYRVKEVEVVGKPSVGIERRRGRVKEGILFTTEVVEPPKSFHFELIVDNVDEGSDEAKLLANVLELLADGYIQLGGRKSVGMGGIEVIEENSVVYELRGCEAIIDPEKGKRMGFREFIKTLRGEVKL